MRFPLFDYRWGNRFYQKHRIDPLECIGIFQSLTFSNPTELWRSTKRGLGDTNTFDPRLDYFRKIQRTRHLGILKLPPHSSPKFMRTKLESAKTNNETKWILCRHMCIGCYLRTLSNTNYISKWNLLRSRLAKRSSIWWNSSSRQRNRRKKASFNSSDSN